MGAYLTIDDMCAGFEPAQTQLATIRQCIAALESALSTAEAERDAWKRISDASILAAKEAAAERDALRRAIRDADDALWECEGSEREIANGWTSECGFDHVETQESYATARLIAAAPELLEALLVAHSHLEMHKLDISHATDAALIRAAIAKATGAST